MFTGRSCLMSDLSVVYQQYNYSFKKSGTCAVDPEPLLRNLRGKTCYIVKDFLKKKNTVI